MEAIRDTANGLAEQLEDGEFIASVKRIRGVFASNVKTGITLRELHTQLKVLREIIIDDTDEKWFAAIPGAKAKLVFDVIIHGPWWRVVSLVPTMTFKRLNSVMRWVEIPLSFSTV